MARTVSASEANQNFSRLLGEVETGEVITIERRGKPIAKLVPTEDDARARRIEAGERMIAYFRSQPGFVTGPWTREDLYDRHSKFNTDDK
ncbi:type II toxin-antitoxin system Phd/YefM family antitoxin [Glacieibacterium sp.]|uniref:type II toxin-antitoxin system Phd/YefM family antitoxin n=1 Tax=Glacieibacterium sp. TaxID=2860237 RepID=UPI003B005CC6